MNPWLLTEKREDYLCALAPPQKSMLIPPLILSFAGFTEVSNKIANPD